MGGHHDDINAFLRSLLHCYYPRYFQAGAVKIFSDLGERSLPLRNCANRESGPDAIFTKVSAMFLDVFFSALAWNVREF